MRLLHAAIAALALAGVTAAQSLSGTYAAQGANPVPWSINQHSTLIWDGQPYLPVGLHIAGSTDEIDKAHKAGIDDVLIDLPVNGAGWEGSVASLEKNAMRYIIGIDALMPSAHAFAVEPEGYRVTGITEDRNVDVSLPGAETAFVMLVTQRDRTVQWTKRVPVVDGHLKVQITAPNTLEHVLLIYPHFTESSHPDYWEGFDTQRDQLLAAIQGAKFGKGLRGVLNPLGRFTPSTSKPRRWVPDSNYFRAEYKNYLFDKYKSVDTVTRAWSMSGNDIDSFDTLARLVPLWSDSRGVATFWDPQTDRTFDCNNARSSAWSDIDTVIRSASTHRFERLVSSLQQRVNVPVLQTWSGWVEPFETGRPVLSGIAFGASGDSSAGVVAVAAKAASSNQRWSRHGWLVCADWDISKSPGAAQVLPNILDDLAALGARAWFVRATTTDQISALKADADRRSTDASYAQWSPTPLFFPERIGNPAFAQRLPGGHFWMPAPFPGVRVDFGSTFRCYRYSTGKDGFTAIWTSGGSGRIKLRMLSSKDVKFETLDGSDPKLKTYNKGVELTLTETPLIISNTSELPIPEIAIQEFTQKDNLIINYAITKNKNVAEEAYAVKNATSAMDKDPSGSYMALLAVYDRLTMRFSNYTWIEAESAKLHNFSEVEKSEGLANGAALSLQSQLIADPRGFFADFEVSLRSKAEQEVWIAARIPEASQRNVHVLIGDQRFDISDAGVSPYSGGYAWYKVGNITLERGPVKLTLQVLSADGGDIGVDAIVLSPGHFQPNGITMPDPVDFKVVQASLNASKGKG